jgi:hypothetical protein
MRKMMMKLEGFAFNYGIIEVYKGKIGFIEIFPRMMEIKYEINLKKKVFFISLT